MKKILILASLVAIPAVSMAASQAAISQRGTCHVFKTASMVPSDWKSIDSCEEYKTEKSGQRLDAVNERRFGNYNWNKRYGSLKDKASETALTGARMGSGKLTRGGLDRVAAGTTEKKELRTTTTRSLGTSKSYLLNDERRVSKSRSDWLRRRSARSGITSGSATQMERSGKLSNKFWSTEASRRDSRLESMTSSSKWKQALSRRQYLSNKGRVEKKEYEYKGPTLRRTYRGDRMEGTLDSGY